MTTSPVGPRPSRGTLAALLGSGAALCALAIYQWLELLTVRAGGTPSCAVNETVNCATVWNSSFANRVHELFGIPVAGMGLVWGLAATVLAGAVFLRAQRGAAVDAPAAAVKLWALAGALVTVTLVTASFRAGAVCPTCLGTYALTAVYVGAALFALPGGVWPKATWLLPGVGWSAVVGGASFLLLLYPGSRTPRAGQLVTGGGHEASQLLAYLNNLPERDAMFASMARAEYLRSPTPDTDTYPTRVRLGPPDAPVKLVDFTDILCGHCRTFEATARELFDVVPKGTLSVEPRYFPLDGQCNREVQRKAADNIRCLGAKVQICLESNPKFWDVRHELFENQQTLSEGRIIEIALGSGVSRDDLMRCVDSYETQSKIEADVAYASMFGIDGTPLVIVNGRKTLPVAPFLLGMALSRGDVNAPFFQKLPPAPPPEDDHAGHGH